MGLWFQLGQYAPDTIEYGGLDYVPERDIWLQRLDDEDGNLRAALAWCLPETEEDLVDQGSPLSHAHYLGRTARVQGDLE